MIYRSGKKIMRKIFVSRAKTIYEEGKQKLNQKPKNRKRKKNEKPNHSLYIWAQF